MPKRITAAFFGLSFFVMLLSNGWALEINDDGAKLIQEAAQAYSSDMRDRPVIVDPVIQDYLNGILQRLAPAGKNPPAGVAIGITAIDSPKPELYSYVSGQIVVTNGMVFSMENEAQLAAVLSRQVAHLTEGYYISLYQQIKAAERKERYKAAAGALFGALLDVAVDYAVRIDEINQNERYFEGEATYSETMKRLALTTAASGAYYTIKDVVSSIPAEEPGGAHIDPRLQFEPIADAQGLEFLALAGYDAAEASKAWSAVHRVNSRMAREREQALGPFAEQMRSMQSLMNANMNRLQQQLGVTGLVQTLSNAPPTRAQFVAKLTALKEVQDAQKSHGARKEKEQYIAFVEKALLPGAQAALKRENYEQAYKEYRLLYDRGIRMAPVVYGMAKSRLGDFAFGASEAEKEEAEKYYREAIRLDPDYAAPHKGLAELYEDWERFEEAAAAYRDYLKTSPDAKDRNRIEKKIKTMKRKASR